jgi:hypothetical protein
MSIPPALAQLCPFLSGMDVAQSICRFSDKALVEANFKVEVLNGS